MLKQLHIATATFAIVVLSSTFYSQSAGPGMPQASRTPEDPMRIFQYRQIGPFRGGRVNAVAGVSSQPNVYYFGATGGGVWKTTDAGENWEPVSDNFFKT